MKPERNFDGYVIPNEYLSKIQGGMDSGIAFVCPLCSEGVNLVMLPLKVYPTRYLCGRCDCIFSVLIIGGEVTTKVIKPGK